jgi:hypothetical protein
MKTRLPIIGFLLAGAVTLAAQDFQSVFAVEKKNLGVKGSNPYFPLTPGYQLSYRHGKDTDTLTVLPETKVIDGVETRVVEDRETKNGQIVEVTRDYYAHRFGNQRCLLYGRRRRCVRAATLCNAGLTV